MKVIFIGGLGRSGSTLFERVLGELPGVCPLGEVTSLWKRLRWHSHERCGCGRALHRCEFWEAVGAKAFGGWHRLDLPAILDRQRRFERIRSIPRLVRHRPAGDRQSPIREHAALYTQVYAAAAAVTGAPVVVDSSKRPALAYCLRGAAHLDMWTVHLVRDPRGVAHSCAKRVSKLAGDGTDLLPRRAPARTAVNWLGHNLAMEALARTGRARVRRIRYEDFLADPAGTVRSLASALGLRIEAGDLAYLRDGHAELGAIHSIAGNPMRFATGRLALRPDDSWRTGLPARHRRTVTALCAPLLAAYGYPLRP